MVEKMTLDKFREQLLLANTVKQAVQIFDEHRPALEAGTGVLRFRVVHIIDQWYQCRLIPVVNNGGECFYDGSESTKEKVMNEARLFAESQAMTAVFLEANDD